MADSPKKREELRDEVLEVLDQKYAEARKLAQDEGLGVDAGRGPYDPKVLGERLMRLFLETEQTRRVFAEEAKISPRGLKKYFDGEHCPNKDRLKNLMLAFVAFDVDPRSLLKDLPLRSPPADHPPEHDPPPEAPPPGTQDHHEAGKTTPAGPIPQARLVATSQPASDAPRAGSEAQQHLRRARRLRAEGAAVATGLFGVLTAVVWSVSAGPDATPGEAEASESRSWSETASETASQPEEVAPVPAAAWEEAAACRSGGELAACVAECDRGVGPSCSVAASLAEADDATNAKRVIGYLQRACDLGDGWACDHLGVRYEHGRGVRVSHAKAAALYYQACAAEHWNGCANLGLAYQYKRGLRLDLVMARDNFRKACEGDEPRGCVYRADLYLEGTPDPDDVVEAMKLYEKSCRELGHGRGCASLGHLFRNGTHIGRDLKRAAMWFEEACDVGSAHECFVLADMRRAGEGVEASADHADEAVADGMQAYRTSCEEDDDLDDCARLANKLLDGEHVPRAPKRAAELLDRICTAGHLSGCERMVELTEGSRVVRAPRKRRHYQERAHELQEQRCTGGSGIDCSKVADAYHEGEYVERSHARALQFRFKACDLGLPYECERLADVVEVRGLQLHGTPESLREKALASRKEACASGDAYDCTVVANHYLQKSDDEEAARVARQYARTACQGEPAYCTELGYRASFELHGLGGADWAAEIYGRAAEARLRECGPGDGWSCVSAAQGPYPLSARFSPDERLQLVEDGCRWAVDYGCERLSRILEHGIATAARPARAAALREAEVERLVESCRHGDVWDCGDLTKYLSPRHDALPSDWSLSTLLLPGCDLHSWDCFRMDDLVRAGHSDFDGLEEADSFARRGYEHLVDECDSWGPYSCGAVAEMDDGPDGSTARERAMGRRAQACDGGGFGQCLLLAERLGRRPEMQEQARALRTRALEQAQRRCDRLESWSCRRLAGLHAAHLIEPASSAEAWRLRERACRLGALQECASVASWHESKRRRQQASAIRRAACYQGDAESCLTLAARTTRPLGTDGPLSGSTAETLRSRAADIRLWNCRKGQTASCVELAKMYRDGVGLEPDPEAAARLVRLAVLEWNQDCDLAAGGACFALLELLEDSPGGADIVGKSWEALLTQTRTQLDAECARGGHSSCGRLGQLFLRHGEASERRLAGQLVRRACLAGDSRSCRHIESSDRRR